jgi:hypothetical protein
LNTLSSKLIHHLSCLIRVWLHPSDLPRTPKEDNPPVPAALAAFHGSEADAMTRKVADVERYLAGPGDT